MADLLNQPGFDGENTPWQPPAGLCFPTGVNASPFFQEPGSGPEQLPRSAARSGRTRIEIHWGALAASAERIRISRIEASSKARLIQLRYVIGTADGALPAVDGPAWAALVIQSERWEC